MSNRIDATNIPEACKRRSYIADVKVSFEMVDSTVPATGRVGCVTAPQSSKSISTSKSRRKGASSKSPSHAFLNLVAAGCRFLA